METILKCKKEIDGDWVDIDFEDLDWSEINDIIAKGKHHFVRDQWIPCSERLPDGQEGNYLVSGSGKIWICEFVKMGVVRGWSNSANNPVVQAWMPLPKPYKI